MNPSRFILPAVFPLFLINVAAVQAADSPPGVAALVFLTGHWRGELRNGRVAEEHFSTPEGGVMLSTGREFKNGRCVFFDLVVFAEQADGSILLTPHPNGRRSEHGFPLIEFDATAKRAVFENAAHDFPRTFIYELIAPDHLRITLRGVIKGESATEAYDLRRVQ